MDHIILNNTVTFNDVQFTNVDIIEVNEDTMQANVNISNTEIYLSVPLSLIGVEHSIHEYFKYNTEIKND